MRGGVGGCINATLGESELGDAKKGKTEVGAPKGIHPCENRKSFSKKVWCWYQILGGWVHLQYWWMKDSRLRTQRNGSTIWHMISANLWGCSNMAEKGKIDIFHLKYLQESRCLASWWMTTCSTLTSSMSPMSRNSFTTSNQSTSQVTEAMVNDHWSWHCNDCYHVDWLSKDIWWVNCYRSLSILSSDFSE